MNGFKSPSPTLSIDPMLRSASRGTSTPRDAARISMAQNMVGTPRPASVVPSGGAFEVCQDFSMMNASSHNAARADTFSTPTRLERKPGTPKTSKGGLTVGTKEVLEVCELSFAKNLRSMHQTLLQDLKDEINTALGPLKQELSGTIADTRGATAMEAILQAIKAIEVPTVDVAPLTAKLQGLQQSSDEAVSRFDARLASDIASLRQENLEAQHHRTELESSQARRIEFMESSMQRLEDQLSQLNNGQQELCKQSSEMNEGIQHMRDSHNELQASTLDTLETQLVKQVKDAPVNVNFEVVLAKIGKSHQSVSGDMSILLTEISKVQKALNVDFAQMLTGFDLQMIQNQLDPQARAELAAAPSRRHSGRLSNCTLSVNGEAGTSSALSLRVNKRMRDIQTQTTRGEQFVEMGTNTDGMWNAASERKRVQSVKPKAPITHARKPISQKNMFADAEVMKQRARDALIKPQYSVFDQYHTEGCFQAIAKSSIFEFATLIVIGMNTIWMAVDTDHNEATLIIHAHPVFVVVENLFCTYFFLEIMTRFFAFRKMKRAFRDFWFVFDSGLVFLMVCETWILSIVAASFGMTAGTPVGDVSILRIVRVLRMLRISRVARVVRAVPELVILIKGVVAASRSVAVFCILWIVLLYIYALILRQIADSTDTKELFPSVPQSMASLLLSGLLPAYAEYMDRITGAHFIYGPILFSFIALAVLTLMNMLVGVLVEVVGAIALTEKESMRVLSLASSLREALLGMCYSLDEPFKKDQFQNLLVQPEIARIVTGAGVDVILLVEMSEAIFDDMEISGKDGIRFEDFVELVLNMRGTNPAKVKDIKEQLRLIKTAVDMATKKVSERFTEEFEVLTGKVQEVKEICEEL